MQKHYTIRDIAEMSGYSIKTVSRVINNEANVKESTKDKILKIISETNYKPNIYAKNLNSKSHKNILVSIRKKHGQNTTRWVDVLMSHLINAANKGPYSVIQEVIYDDSELKNSIIEISGGYIDVIVLFYLEENDKRIELARKNNIPYISFEKNDHVEISISNNNRKGILEATKYLFSRDLTKICLLLGAKNISANEERSQAIKEAYQQHQVSMDYLEIVYDMNNLEKIKRFTESKISKAQLPDVFFVSGDEKAIAVYQALHQNGLSIPKDVSIIGFDNIPISQYYFPPLTTVGQNFEQLAQEMFHAIDRLLTSNEHVTSVEVDPQLIIRESVR